MEGDATRFPEEAREAIEAYLALLKQPPADQQLRYAALARVLDRLVAGYHLVPDLEVGTIEVETPDFDYGEFRRLSGEAFPDLGCYCDVEPTGDLDQEPGVADAIDDLADIARDLTTILWLLDNHGVADAAFEYRFGFQFHWGGHLFSLRRHLHTTDIAAF